MKTIHIAFLMLLCFSLFVSCKEDNETDTPSDSIEAKLNGTWDLAQPTYQYVDANGGVLHEIPHSSSGPGEVTFDMNKHIYTFVEEDGSATADTYVVTSASGKNYITIGTNNNSSTIEIMFPTNNQMIWILPQVTSSIQYADDNGNYQTASSTRLHTVLTKKL